MIITFNSISIVIDTMIIVLSLRNHSFGMARCARSVSCRYLPWSEPLLTCSIVDIGELHSDDEIWKALDRVSMKDAVSALPEKLDSVIEDGGSLSRGQVRLSDHFVYDWLSDFVCVPRNNSYVLHEYYCERRRS